MSHKHTKIIHANIVQMNNKENMMLDTFQNRYLRRIIGIKWPDVISNDELYRRTEVLSLGKEEKRRRWRWIGIF